MGGLLRSHSTLHLCILSGKCIAWQYPKRIPTERLVPLDSLTDPSPGFMTTAIQSTVWVEIRVGFPLTPKESKLPMPVRLNMHDVRYRAKAYRALRAV
jgi:hypothetical protein